jgi:hypothetical protein
VDDTSALTPGRHERPGSRRRHWLAALLAVTVLFGAVFVGLRLFGASGPGDGQPASAAAIGSGRPTADGDPAAAVTPSGSASATPAAGASAATSRPASPEAGRSTAPRPPAKSTPKKGVSVWDFNGLGPALTDVKASWYYNWASGKSSGAPASAQFVPMIWGAKSVTATELNRARSSGATTLLGFNEPDFDSQANMTVEQALDLWPQLQATGLRLGSPAPAVNGAKAGDWLDRFITGARERGLRVDFIALHWYGSDFSDAAVGHLRGYLQAVWDRYRLPIWLTEYALIKWSGGGAVYPTDAQQASFVTKSTAMMEGLSYVERYAWFALPTPRDRQGTGLYRDGATPTAAGLAYRAAG